MEFYSKINEEKNERKIEKKEQKKNVLLAQHMLPITPFHHAIVIDIHYSVSLQMHVPRYIRPDAIVHFNPQNPKAERIYLKLLWSLSFTCSCSPAKVEPIILPMCSAALQHPS